MATRPDVGGTDYDPRSREATIESLKLIVQAEMLVHDLNIHLEEMQALMEERKRRNERFVIG